MCWRRDLSSATNPADLQRRWGRLVFLTTCGFLLAIYVTIRLAFTTVHICQRYNVYLAEAVANRDHGQDVYNKSCQGKWPDKMKTSLLDCEGAIYLKDTVPHIVALDLILRHLTTDHLSPGSWIYGCHDGECNSFIWNLCDKLLKHFSQFMILLMLGCILLLIFLIMLLPTVLQYLSARRNMQSLLRQNNPLQPVLNLMDTARDAQHIQDELSKVSAMQSNLAQANNFLDAIRNSYGQPLKVEVENMPVRGNYKTVDLAASGSVTNRGHRIRPMSGLKGKDD